VPVDPLIVPRLPQLPPFPEVIEDWAALREQELANADDFADQIAEPAPEGASKRTVTIPVNDGSIQLDIYAPPIAGPHPVHVYFHGGGWIGGSINTKIIDIQMKERCLGANCVAVAVEYRKAPEHKFPVGLQDCYAALEWVVAHLDELDGSPEAVSVGGGSAGANLAAAVCIKARDEQGPAIAFQLLEVPALDLTMASPSIEENGSGYGLTKRDLPLIFAHYLKDPAVETLDPLVSPLLAPDLSGLPPAYIMSSEYDPVRDDGARYADRLQQAGVEAVYSLQRGHIHMSGAFTALLPSARTWRQEMLDALRSAHTKAASKAAGGGRP
jgi:acetyl esterase